MAGRGFDALAASLARRLPAAQPDPEARALAERLLAAQSMLADQTAERQDRTLFLQGQIAARQLTGRRLRHLGEAEFRVTSQWGEDGIIEFLCQTLPDIPRSFVEFGVEGFSEANTRFLLEHRGWRGLVMDGNTAQMAALRGQALYWRHDLTAVAAFVTTDNINRLIADNGFTGDIGLLSIDIDGNDYWVLEAIDCVRPTILICEFNGVFGDVKEITVPYRPDFHRFEAHFSGQYFGCSLAALQALCGRRGYRFIGCNTNGVNAFFVREDLAGAVVERLVELRAWPPRHRDSRDRDGTLNFTRGLARTELLADMPVVDLRTGGLLPLRSLTPLYSDAFLSEFQ